MASKEAHKRAWANGKRFTDRFRVGGLPTANVRYELQNDEPLRALDERYRAAIGRHA